MKTIKKLTYILFGSTIIMCAVLTPLFFQYLEQEGPAWLKYNDRLSMISWFTMAMLMITFFTTGTTLLDQGKRV